MGVSKMAARPAGGGMPTVSGHADDGGERLAVAVVGGDDVLAARIHAALRREGVPAHVRWPVGHADPGSGAPDVVVLAAPADDAPEAAVGAVRRRLPDTRAILALPPGVDAPCGAPASGDGAPDGIVADADLDLMLGLVVRCARAGYVAVPAGGARAEPPAFSPRERQIVRLVLLGLTNDEIAQRLFIAKSTVAGHLTSIFRRFGVRSRRQLVTAVLAGDEGVRRTFLAVALPGEEQRGPDVAA